MRTRGMLMLVMVPLALAAILPAHAWHHRGHLPYTPTYVPGSWHVASCQRYAAGWSPTRSNVTLRRWEKCMGIAP